MEFASYVGLKQRNEETIAVICLLAAGIIASQFVTISAIQPIGALPEGGTLVSLV